MNQNQNYQNGNICKDFKEFLGRIINAMPLFIKIVVFSTIILYILNLFTQYVAFFLADIPYFTIFYIQIWRLFTTAFMTTNILSIIFSLYFWFKDAVKLEKQIGTIKYMLIFLMNSICIQIIYCILMFLLSLIIQSSFVLKMKITPTGIRNEGLWPILMCDLTLLCLSNPEAPMRFFIFPCVIKAKYYPLVLFLIFTIINGFNFDFEILCGIAYGFLYHYYLKNKLNISNNFALKIENSCLFRWMKNRNGFIHLGGVSIPELQNNLENVRNVNINQNNSNAPRPFRAFRGKGIAVGGGDQNKNNSNNNNNNNTTTNNSTNTSTENNNNNSNYNNNVTISSSDEINSTDSRLDLNSSTNQK